MIAIENQGHQGLPCVSSINRIPEDRNHLMTREASLTVARQQRFEKLWPNEMWRADYKGHFAVGDGRRCHPLNIIDNYRCFNLCCQAQYTETFEEIKSVMVWLFREYGLPFSFLCDDGNPWRTVQSTGVSSFEVWPMELGILTLHGPARHPQTKGEGREL